MLYKVIPFFFFLTNTYFGFSQQWVDLYIYNKSSLLYFSHAVPLSNDAQFPASWYGVPLKIQMKEWPSWELHYLDRTIPASLRTGLFPTVSVSPVSFLSILLQKGKSIGTKALTTRCPNIWSSCRDLVAKSSINLFFSCSVLEGNHFFLYSLQGSALIPGFDTIIDLSQTTQHRKFNTIYSRVF